MSSEPWVVWIGVVAALVAAFGVLWRTLSWIINRHFGWRAWYVDTMPSSCSKVLYQGKHIIRVRIKPLFQARVDCLQLDFAVPNFKSWLLRSEPDSQSPRICGVSDEYVAQGWSPTKDIRRVRDAGAGLFVFYEPPLICPKGESIWLAITIEAEYEWEGFLSIQHRFGAPWRRSTQLPLKIVSANAPKILLDT